MAGLNPRLWDGLDPVEPGPQPSRPSPAFGAPDIGQRPIKEVIEVPIFGDHSVNGGYGHKPIVNPLPQPPAE